MDDDFFDICVVVVVVVWLCGKCGGNTNNTNQTSHNAKLYLFQFIKSFVCGISNSR